MTVEELNVILEASTKDFEKKFNAVEKQLKSVGRNVKQAGDDVDRGTKSANKGFAAMAKGAAKAAIVIKSVEMAVRSIKKMTDAYAETQTAYGGLESILDKQGKSFSDAKQWIKEYTEDGLIPLADAYAAYKNLSAAGYDDSQTRSILQNLKDASAYGRQGSLSMGEAIRSATEGIKNENSVLVDNAGVSKNLSVIWEEYASSVGKSVANLTDEEKRLATVNGLIRETAFQTGDAAKYSREFAGAQAALKAQLKSCSSAIGSIFAPALQSLSPHVINLIKQLTELAERAGQVMAIVFGTKKDSGTKAQAEATKHVAAQTQAVSSGWEKAKKKATAYKNAILGIDEINVLNTPDASSSESGGTGAGGGGGASSSYVSPLANADNVIDPEIAKRAEEVGKKVDQIKEKIRKFIEPTKRMFHELWLGIQDCWKEGIKPLGEAILGLDFEPVTVLGDLTNSDLKWFLYDVGDALGFVADLITGDFSGAFEHLKDLFWDNRIGNFNENLDICKEHLEKVKEKVKSLADSMKEKFSDAYENVSAKTEDFYNNKIAPWFTQEKWDEIYKSIGISFGNAVNGVINFWQTTLPKWWEEDVSPWFTKEKWKTEFNNIKNGMTEKWDEFSNVWSSKISGWWSNKVAPWFTKEKWKTLGTGMKDGIVAGFNAVINGIINILNKGIGKTEQWANNIIRDINTMIDGFNSVSVVKAKKVPEVSFNRIPAYKQGGFVEEGPFYMNQGEMVGRFSNGKTAVANNEQITEGIARAVQNGLRDFYMGVGAAAGGIANVELHIIKKDEHGNLLGEMQAINLKAGRQVISLDL